MFFVKHNNTYHAFLEENNYVSSKLSFCNHKHEKPRSTSDWKNIINCQKCADELIIGGANMLKRKAEADPEAKKSIKTEQEQERDVLIVYLQMLSIASAKETPDIIKVINHHLTGLDPSKVEVVMKRLASNSTVDALFNPAIQYSIIDYKVDQMIVSRSEVEQRDFDERHFDFWSVLQFAINQIEHQYYEKWDYFSGDTFISIDSVHVDIPKSKRSPGWENKFPPVLPRKNTMFDLQTLPYLCVKNVSIVITELTDDVMEYDAQFDVSKFSSFNESMGTREVADAINSGRNEVDKSPFLRTVIDDYTEFFEKVMNKREYRLGLFNVLFAPVSSNVGYSGNGDTFDISHSTTLGSIIESFLILFVHLLSEYRDNVGTNGAFFDETFHDRGLTLQIQNFAQDFLTKLPIIWIKRERKYTSRTTARATVLSWVANRKIMLSLLVSLSKFIDSIAKFLRVDLKPEHWVNLSSDRISDKLDTFFGYLKSFIASSTTFRVSEYCVLSLNSVHNPICQSNVVKTFIPSNNNNDPIVINKKPETTQLFSFCEYYFGQKWAKNIINLSTYAFVDPLRFFPVIYARVDIFKKLEQHKYEETLDPFISVDAGKILSNFMKEARNNTDEKNIVKVHIFINTTVREFEVENPLAKQLFCRIYENNEDPTKFEHMMSYIIQNEKRAFTLSLSAEVLRIHQEHYGSKHITAKLYCKPIDMNELSLLGISDPRELAILASVVIGDVSRMHTELIWHNALHPSNIFFRVEKGVYKFKFLNFGPAIILSTKGDVISYTFNRSRRDFADFLMLLFSFLVVYERKEGRGTLVGMMVQKLYSIALSTLDEDDGTFHAFIKSIKSTFELGVKNEYGEGSEARLLHAAFSSLFENKEDETTTLSEPAVGLKKGNLISHFDDLDMKRLFKRDVSLDRKVDLFLNRASVEFISWIGDVLLKHGNVTGGCEIYGTSYTLPKWFCDVRMDLFGK